MLLGVSDLAVALYARSKQGIAWNPHKGTVAAEDISTKWYTVVQYCSKHRDSSQSTPEGVISTLLSHNVHYKRATSL